MPKGIPNKRYTPEFEKLVVETMPKEKLSYRKAARQFEISSDKRVAAWEGIYLEEGPEGLAVERRGRGSKGHPPKQLPKGVDERRQHKKRRYLMTELPNFLSFRFTNAL